MIELKGFILTSHWMPRAMRVPPQLDPEVETPLPTAKCALLNNPFYPKDPHASFGKHVLTPSLALTSIAGSTPAGDVTYWDENLLHGPPPFIPGRRCSAMWSRDGVRWWKRPAAGI